MLDETVGHQVKVGVDAHAVGDVSDAACDGKVYLLFQFQASVTGSVTRKKLLNVCKSCPIMISLKNDRF